MRVNIILAIGVEGEEEDLQKFMELIVADYEHRAAEIADDIMGGQVRIIPQEEIIGDEVPESPGSPS